MQLGRSVGGRYVLDRAAIQGYLMLPTFIPRLSRHEGFPVAPLEGNAMATAPVAADARC